MAIRVAHFATGNVGQIALRQLIADPRFELTGVWVSSDAKVGKDAGELARIDVSTGITATKDMGSLLADQPDCAVYCASESRTQVRFSATTQTICRDPANRMISRT